MKLFKKNVKIIIVAIIGIIIGMLITGGIVFATGQYNASEVRYDTTTVAGALDNLYNYAKNKSDLAEQMNKPNTWVVGTEYDFGDGLYGQRFTGEMTMTANSATTISLNVNNVNAIINQGGFLTWNNGNRHSAFVTDYGNWGSCIFVDDSNDDIKLRVRVVTASSCTYDIWVLYTK